jgi:hypothetical protein
MSLSIAYSFSPTTIIESGQVNQNFSDIVSYINETVCVANGDGAMFLGWKGSVASIPPGWVLDADFKDKFILGAGNLYAVGATGGEINHILTIAEIPSHDHPYLTASNVNGSSNYGENGEGTATTGHTTSKTGGGASHNNMPPYYAACWIRKT